MAGRKLITMDMDGTRLTSEKAIIPETVRDMEVAAAADNKAITWEIRVCYSFTSSRETARESFFPIPMAADRHAAIICRNGKNSGNARGKYNIIGKTKTVALKWRRKNEQSIIGKRKSE